MKPLSAEHIWIHVLVKSPSSVMELLESVVAKIIKDRWGLRTWKGQTFVSKNRPQFVIGGREEKISDQCS